MKGDGGGLRLIGSQSEYKPVPAQMPDKNQGASGPKPGACTVAGPRISIVVPTLNEAENIPLLVPRLAQALQGRSWEVLIVDDNSRDATPKVCEELARTYPLKLLVRTKPTHGLSGAVLHGFAQATGDVLCCMDADLQHPPEKLPELVDAVTVGGADFALGSRHEEGGGTEQAWGAFRQLNSWVATVLAKPFSGGVKDPMSGFFALRRETFAKAKRLSPLGYKIALELMCKCRVKQVREIPIRFGLRLKGESKLSMKQQFHYLQHLSRLYDFTFPRTAPILKFLIVLAIGLVASGGVFFAARAGGAGILGAALGGYALHLVISALFHVRYTRAQEEFMVRHRPWFDFSVISFCEVMTLVAAVEWLLWRLVNPRDSEVFVLSFLAATAARYVLRKELLQDIRGLRRERRLES
jgi:dolichol-phosphate mannosyltransferase